MPEMAHRGSVTSSPLVAASSPRLRYANEQEGGDPHVPDSIPPWVHLDAHHGPPAPQPTRPNTRHWKPPPPPHYRPGKKWDHLRSAEPAFIDAPIAERQEEWRPFMRSGPEPGVEELEGPRLMSPEWAEENIAIFSRKWTESDDIVVGRNEKAQGYWILDSERRDRSMRVFWRLLLKNPFVPLVFRITVLAFCAAALGIAATIYQSVNAANTDSDPNNQCATRASTYMALAVGSVAVPYIGYVTWDEYTSKPLGLRSAFAKTSLLLVDLYFIVFSASNLSLAFDALFDRRWACYNEQYTIVGRPDAFVDSTCPNNPDICYKQKALSSVLFLSLIAWLITFGISVMRVVEKLRV